jgi:hypothetical protein
MLLSKQLSLTNALRINISQVYCLLVLIIVRSYSVIRFDVYFLSDKLGTIPLAIATTEPYLAILDMVIGYLSIYY